MIGAKEINKQLLPFMNTQIHLFVQDGCRPCTYVKTQMNKVPGANELVTITNAKENDEWTQFAEDCGVTATPMLVALNNGQVVGTMVGSNNMNREFWTNFVMTNQ